MDLQTIYDTIPPWEWPKDTGKMIHNLLDDRSATPSERLLATKMAGNLVVFNDELATTLLSIVSNSDEVEVLRSKAAISFGPAFEHADLYEFDDPSDIILSADIFREAQTLFKEFFYNDAFPKDVRRNILEAAVRAPLDWHSEAVNAAFTNEDESWQLTAVFCMYFLQGFEQQIIEALQSDNLDIRYQALLAAGNWGLEKAWPSVAAVLSDPAIEKNLLLANIEAAASIGLSEAIDPLLRLLDSDDNDVIDAASEALAMLDEHEFDDTYEDDDW